MALYQDTPSGLPNAVATTILKASTGSASTHGFRRASPDKIPYQTYL